MFMGLLDPDQYSLGRGMDSDFDADSDHDHCKIRKNIKGFLSVL
jgi:hypothetical protein